LSKRLKINAVFYKRGHPFFLSEGKGPYQAVFDSGVSRVRPVAMAAISTILGMSPLLFDVFFQSMAVTIMFG